MRSCIFIILFTNVLAGPPANISDEQYRTWKSMEEARIQNLIYAKYFKDNPPFSEMDATTRASINQEIQQKRPFYHLEFQEEIFREKINLEEKNARYTLETKLNNDQTIQTYNLRRHQRMWQLQRYIEERHKPMLQPPAYMQDIYEINKFKCQRMEELTSLYMLDMRAESQKDSLICEENKTFNELMAQHKLEINNLSNSQKTKRQKETSEQTKVELHKEKDTTISEENTISNIQLLEYISVVIFVCLVSLLKSFFNQFLDKLILKSTLQHSRRKSKN